MTRRTHPPGGPARRAATPGGAAHRTAAPRGVPRGRWLACAVVVALAAAGCGVRPQAHPEPISTANVGTPLVPATSSSAAPASPASPVATEDVRVYLVRQDRLVAVHRRVPLSGGLSGRVAALLAGPTPAEAASGLTTAIPAGTRMDVRTVGGVAVAALPAGFRTLSGAEQILALAQLVYTVTADGGATGLTLTERGSPIEMAVDGGRLVEGPVGRASYLSVAPA